MVEDDPDVVRLRVVLELPVNEELAVNVEDTVVEELSLVVVPVEALVLDV